MNKPLCGADLEFNIAVFTYWWFMNLKSKSLPFSKKEHHLFFHKIPKGWYNINIKISVLPFGNGRIKK